MPAADLKAALDFEFTALSEARNYRTALVRELQTHLRGRVLEVGAGIGQMTAELKQLPQVDQLVSVEPDPKFCRLFREAHPAQTLIEGTVHSVPKSEPWNAIVSVNVLEHIREDQAELDAYHNLLSPTRGSLCLFVPARPEIYAPIDRAFGHYRRYTRRTLSSRLREAGFQIVRLRYFNLPGYFGWWLMFRVLKKSCFNPGGVRWFDRFIFPPTHWLETKLIAPPFGQSLLVIAQAGIPKHE